MSAQGKTGASQGLIRVLEERPPPRKGMRAAINMKLFSYESSGAGEDSLPPSLKRLGLFIWLLTAGSLFASEDPTSQFSAAVRKAVLENPQVNLEWHRFDAAQESQRAAKGALLPEVNLSANAGREDRATPQTAFDPYNAQSGTLTVRQLLFDGFTALETVRERKFESAAQYFQLRNTAEQVGLEAADAFLDTYRHQQLVEYAIDNLIEHRELFLKIQERSLGGLDAESDFDQAEARLKLAESNLLVEINNLNDLKNLYQRLVGMPPADGLQLPERELNLPADREIALNLAYESNPFLEAQVETSRARQAGLRASRGRFFPTLNLQYRNSTEKNRDGVLGNFDEQALEVALTMNLYRGGTDVSLSREAQSLYYSAIEAQRLACINVRQNVLDAYNEIEILGERISILESNLASQERSKEAYKQQFELNERSLLDMLDGVNEYFVTRNSLLNARIDQNKARHRALASIGVFLTKVGVSGARADVEAAYELALLERGARSNFTTCPSELPERSVIEIARIYEKTDAEYEAQRQNSLNGTFEGDGGFGGFEGDGGFGSFEGDGGFGGFDDGGGFGVFDEPLEATDPFLTETQEEDVGPASELYVYYAVDSAEIPQEFDDELEAVAVRIFENPDLRVLVEGHADDTGTRSHNNKLSNQRADAVKNRLVQQYALDPNQIDTIGFGEDRPAGIGAEARVQNRRAVILIQ